MCGYEWQTNQTAQHATVAVINRNPPAMHLAPNGYVSVQATSSTLVLCR